MDEYVAYHFEFKLIKSSQHQLKQRKGRHEQHSCNTLCLLLFLLSWLSSLSSKPKHIAPQTIRPQPRPSIHRSNNFDRPSFENLVLSSSAQSIAAHNAAAAVANATNSANPSGQVDLIPQLQAGYPLSRQRHHLIRTARGRTGIIFGSRPLIPASSVPEELIEQVRTLV
jgi:hypothetical protein